MLSRSYWLTFVADLQIRAPKYLVVKYFFVISMRLFRLEQEHSTSLPRPERSRRHAKDCRASLAMTGSPYEVLEINMLPATSLLVASGGLTSGKLKKL